MTDLELTAALEAASKPGAPKVRVRELCRRTLKEPDGPVQDDVAKFVLEEVLPRHPYYADKAGPGVRELHVRDSGFGGTRCFWLVRTDGTAVDISYQECLNPSLPAKPASRVRLAARFEVAAQIGEFRDRFETLMETGIVHHDRITFAGLWKAFCLADSVDEASIVLVSPEVGCGDTFADRELAERWREFHRANAVLQLVDKDEHKKIHYG